MKNIIFIAPPAAGKGTQSNMLKEKFGYNHISTGDMLREAINSGSEIGKEVKNIIDKGELVSDVLIIKLVKDKLTSLKGKPFILDGFPRTLNQAESLDKILTDDYIVIYLDLDESEAINRITGRLTCNCGKSYNVNIDKLKPKVDGICDNCGSILIKRDDDNVESFKVRFKTFLDNTDSILKYYEDKEKLIKIDVNKDVQDIFESILEVAND
ncbi:MAG TPA: nucleoside monophosphate kinase [Candidatus Onthocola stercorigallinarum]|nr:nucleoside monophosphate kinase [Candidatus Onthocola stercorigallinarum]